MGKMILITPNNDVKELSVVKKVELSHIRQKVLCCMRI